MSNTGTPSTRWAYRKVKITRAPKAQGDRGPQAHNFVGLSRVPAKEPVHLSLVYRGGSEAWWLVTARGRKVMLPGWMALHDVGALVHGDNP